MTSIRFRLFSTIVPICLALLFASVPSQAQSTGTATLRGTIYDGQHSVVAGAKVALINEASGVERVVTSGPEGAYYFTAVPSGMYSLRVEMQGFNTQKVTAIELRAADSRGADVTLQLGQTSETVTVQGGASTIVETETGAKQYTLGADKLDNLSLIGRSPQELMRIIPGVVAPNQTAQMTVGMQSTGRFDGYSANGQNGTNNRFTLDGSRLQHMGDGGTQMLVMNIDMLQEVRIQTSNYSAEHGSSGVQVTGITKAGGKDFHGAVYDYLRPNALLANDRSNNYAGAPKPANDYQFFGGNIGGPLTKSRQKAFFFFGTEIQRQTVDDGTFLAVVPTLKQRQGDFSELLAAPAGRQLFNQPTTVRIPQGFPGAGGAAPNNNLTPYVTRLGQGLMNLYPEPNYTDPNGRYNFYGQNLYPLNRNTQVGRVDYNLSDRTKLFLRLAHDFERVRQPFGSWFRASDIPNRGGVEGTGRGESGALSIVNVISPSITNEVLLSVTANQLTHDYTKPDEITLAAVNGAGFRGLFPETTGRAPAAIFSQAFPGGNMNQQQNLPLVSQGVNYSITENLAVFRGRHALKFGFHWEQFNIHDNNGNCQYGCIDLNTTATPGTTGNDFGDLLVGRPFQFRQTTPISQAHWRQNDIEFYAQDTYKVRPNLTLDLGLRVSYFPLGWDIRGRSTAFDGGKYDRSQGLLINGDPLNPNGVVIASRDNLPKGAISGPGLGWGPRIGFAYDLFGSGKTVIRGGWGMFYNRANKNFIGSPQNTNAPWVYGAAIDATSGASLGSGLGLTYDTIQQVNPFSRLSTVNFTGQREGSAKLQTAMTQSFSISQTLPGHQVLEVGYVGTLSRHLAASRLRNIIPQGALLQGTIGNADLSGPINRVALSAAAKNAYRPYPAYTNVATGEFENTGNYHSLQATLNRKATDKLTYLLSYTFSKSLGTGTGGGSNANSAPFARAIDPIDTRGRSYGPLSTDRTHILNVSYIYDLPSLARSGALAKGILNNWRLSGIASYISSPPIRLSLTGAIANVGIAQAYFGTDASLALQPAFTGDPRRSASKVGEKLYDLGALAIPAYGSLGPYQSPYYLRAQGTLNSDLTLFKEFPIRESKKLQFRFAAFNLFNQAFAGSGDVITSLATTCNASVNGIPNGSGGVSNNVCDPSRGFSITPASSSQFGQIITKRGRRIMEVVVKFYF